MEVQMCSALRWLWPGVRCPHPLKQGDVDGSARFPRQNPARVKVGLKMLHCTFALWFILPTLLFFNKEAHFTPKPLSGVLLGECMGNWFAPQHELLTRECPIWRTGPQSCRMWQASIPY